MRIYLTEADADSRLYVLPWELALMDDAARIEEWIKWTLWAVDASDLTGRDFVIEPPPSPELLPPGLRMLKPEPELLECRSRCCPTRRPLPLPPLRKMRRRLPGPYGRSGLRDCRSPPSRVRCIRFGDRSGQGSSTRSRQLVSHHGEFWRCATSNRHLPSGDALDDLLSTSAKPVLVVVSAERCAPCRRLSASLPVLARRFVDAVRIVEVDADADAELDFVSRWPVAALPSLLLFRDGHLADRTTGRVRHARMGRLVQPSKAAGAYRKHPARRSRSALLCANRRATPWRRTQTKRPPANPGRFSASTLVDHLAAMPLLAGSPSTEGWMRLV